MKGCKFLTKESSSFLVFYTIKIWKIITYYLCFHFILYEMHYNIKVYKKKKKKVYWSDKENLMNPSEVNFETLRQVN